MKKLLLSFLTLMMCTSLLAGCGSSSNTATTSVPVKEESTERINVNIASLKGPTTMGLVKLMSDAESKKTAHDYKVTMFGSADEIVAKIANGEVDVAAVPCNLASVLYNKTKGNIQVAAINTLGVLYMVENSNQINSISDLKGKTIYTTGKGTTPEYVLNYILSANGIDPEKDVTIEFKSEATEVAALLSQSENSIAMLPQPFVTVAQTKNEKLRIALDMTKEWDTLQKDSGSTLVTGVVIARKAFIENNPVAFNQFLEDYKTSTDYANQNTDETAALIGKYEIVPEPIAKKALPLCKISFIEGDEMKTKISGYLQVLFDQNPQAVGGSLPDDAFYYSK